MKKIVLSISWFNVGFFVVLFCICFFVFGRAYDQLVGIEILEDYSRFILKFSLCIEILSLIAGAGLFVYSLETNDLTDSKVMTSAIPLCKVYLVGTFCRKNVLKYLDTLLPIILLAVGVWHFVAVCKVRSGKQLL